MATTDGLCPSCGADASSKDARCPACDSALPRAGEQRGLRGLVVTAEEVLPQAEWRCPRCPDRALEGLHRHGLMFAVCPGCLGAWVQHGALDGLRMSRALRERVLSAEEPPPERRVDVDRPAACPVCRDPMAQVRFARVSDVTVDVCTAHGLWLDEGALKRIAEFLQAGGLVRARTARDAELGKVTVYAASAAMVPLLGGNTGWDWLGRLGELAAEMALELFLELLADLLGSMLG